MKFVMVLRTIKLGKTKNNKITNIKFDSFIYTKIKILLTQKISRS